MHAAAAGAAAAGGRGEPHRRLRGGGKQQRRSGQAPEGISAPGLDSAHPRRLPGGDAAAAAGGEPEDEGGEGQQDGCVLLPVHGSAVGDQGSEEGREDQGHQATPASGQDCVPGATGPWVLPPHLPE
uniref:Pleckstrin homology and RhoGEF domain containing G5 n=2 Tax=Macaca TaxID=9539 RepID=A0A2K6E585_MACNE|nr:unnamed protein product [Macaca fascicularis]